MSEFQRELVRMESISKAFPGVQALKNIHVTIHAGEVHALVGENGAGKSTLIKILMGVCPKDQGDIFIEGKSVEIHSPMQAKAHGLGAVYQDINIARHLSVGENFFLGNLPVKTTGLIDWKQVYDVTSQTLQNLDIFIDPRTLVKQLSPAKQEMVTIAKAVHQNSKLLVFDEPTALLATEEVDELFALIRKLQANQVGIIYISHRLEEIFTICDTVTVLKDGEWVDTLPVASTNEDELIRKMVGRTIEEMYAIQHPDRGKKVLEIRGLSKDGKFEDVSFDLHAGEVVGLFGLVGSGRTDIVRAIFGADAFDAGEVLVHGDPVEIHSPVDGIAHHIGLLPEDRKQQGLALSLSVGMNVNLSSYDTISRWGVINLQQERQRAEQYIRDLRIVTPSLRQKVENLSGGNQQKVVIGKWLCRDSDIFIFDEPTVGVDVGAKVEIYKLIENLLAQGHAIIFISSYLPEIMGLADRIIVIHEGRISGALRAGEYDEEAILRLASGITN